MLHRNLSHSATVAATASCALRVRAAASIVGDVTLRTMSAKYLSPAVLTFRASSTRTWKRWSAAAAPGRVSYWFFDDIRDQPERVRREIVEYIGAPDTKFSIDAGYDRKAEGVARAAFRRMSENTSDRCSSLK